MRRGNSGLIVSASAFGAMTLGSPLAGGFLNGKIHSRKSWPKRPGLRDSTFCRSTKRVGFQVFEKIRVIANEHNPTVAQITPPLLLSNPSLVPIHPPPHQPP